MKPLVHTFVRRESNTRAGSKLFFLIAFTAEKLLAVTNQPCDPEEVSSNLGDPVSTFVSQDETRSWQDFNSLG